MKHFVVVYNRRTHEVRLEEAPDGRAALARRFELERARSDADQEIVALTSDSIDTVKRTHGRYFKSVGDIARERYRQRVLRRPRPLRIT